MNHEVQADKARQISDNSLIDGTLLTYSQLTSDPRQRAIDVAEEMTLTELLNWVDIADIVGAMDTDLYDRFMRHAQETVAAALVNDGESS